MDKEKMILFMGIQASGKTTLYHKQFHEYVHINLDTLHTRNKEKIAIEECLAHRKSMVIDNTNPTRMDRARYISFARAHGYQVIGYFFQSRVADCITRNEKREKKAHVPRTAIAATSNKLELPDYEEGFDMLYFVHIEQGQMVIEEWIES